MYIPKALFILKLNEITIYSREDDNARQLVRGALGTLEARASRAATPLAARARPPLRKAVFHLAWSPDTLPTPQVKIEQL